MLRNICNHLYSVQFVANLQCCGCHFVSASALNQALFSYCVYVTPDSSSRVPRSCDTTDQIHFGFLSPFLMKCKADFRVVHFCYLSLFLAFDINCVTDKEFYVFTSSVFKLNFYYQLFSSRYNWPQLKINNQHKTHRNLPQGCKKEKCRCFEPIVIYLYKSKVFVEVTPSLLQG